MTAPRTTELLHHLATRPGHDEVKADFRQLLVEELGIALSALEFEVRAPVIRGRLDALIGRTVFEAKSNLKDEWLKGGEGDQLMLESKAEMDRPGAPADQVAPNWRRIWRIAT